MALNYVSGTAEPQPVIMADVTIPLGEDKPDQVDIELVWNGTDTISQSFDSVGFDPGTSVRVAIPVEQTPAQLPTGVYEYIVKAEAIRNSVVDLTYVDTAEYVVVNRSESAYGAGWSMGGVGRLHLDQRDDAILLEEGDGSAALYEQDPADSDRWIAPLGAFRDTIQLDLATSPLYAADDYSLDVDGSDYLSISGGSHTGLMDQDKMTWAFWIKPDGGSRRIGGVTTGSDPHRVWWIDTDNSGQDVRITIFNEPADAPAYVSAGTLTDSTWNYVAIVYDGTQGTVDDRLKIYIDGVLKTDSEVGADVPAELWTSASAAFEWGDLSSASNAFSGEMGQLAIFDQAVSASDIGDWDEDGIDFTHTGLVAGYHWDNTFDDVSSSGNDLTEVGSISYVSNAGYATREAPAIPPGTQAPVTARYLDLDGTEYVEYAAPAPSAMMGESQMTWAFWIKPDAAASERLGGISTGSDPHRVWWMSTDNSGADLSVTIFNEAADGPAVVTAPGITADEWNFVTVVYDGTKATVSERLAIYINAVEQSATRTGESVPTVLASSASADFEWGDLSSATNPFTGLIGEFAMLDTVLTSSEVAAWDTLGINFSHGKLAAGYRWRDTLEDRSTGSYDLTGSDIGPSDYGATSDYPARGSPGPTGTFYARQLKGGTEILYDTLGRQRWVTDRVGQMVEYRYVADTVGAPLSQVQIAPHSQEHVYSIAYDGNDRIESIADPGGRILDIIRSGDSNIGFLDPGQTDTVAIAYTGGLLTSWTSRRGNTTTYGYAGDSPYLDSISLPATAAGTAITSITTIQAQGLASGESLDTATLLADARIEFDGPLDTTDVTSFRVNGFQAPLEIEDAEGNVTTVEYGDADFPLLATRTQDPVGFVTEATYDSRGNLSSSASESRLTPEGQPQVSTTTYDRADSNWPDFVTTVTPPHGAAVFLTYDSATGNRLTQRDGRTESQVAFEYYSSGPARGLLRSTDLPGSAPPDTLKYDDNGNLASAKTSIGFLTTFFSDRYGRDTLVVSPVDSAQTVYRRSRTSFDPLNRVDTTWTEGDDVKFKLSQWPDTLTASAGVMKTIRSYDADGNVIATVAIADADTVTSRSWAYDALGQQTSEADAWSKTKTTAYDIGGRALELITRLGDTIRTEYDLLGRPIERIVPARAHAEVSSGLLDSELMTTPDTKIPYYPNDGGTGIVVPRDSITFSYDGAGRLLTANNRTALISRGYAKNGLLLGDTIEVREYAQSVGCDDEDPQACDYPVSFGSSNVFVLQHGYDLEGRRIWTRYPSSPKDTVRYAYDAVHGQLKSVTDAKGEEFRLFYDHQTRLDSINLPGDIGERREYDHDGRLSVRDRQGSGHSYANESLRYNAQGQIVEARRAAFSDFTHYSALGPVVGFHRNVEPLVPEFMVVDPAGNLLYKTQKYSTDSLRYEHVYDRSRVTLIHGVGIPDSVALADTEFTYDDAGNNLVTHNLQLTEEGAVKLDDLSANFYGADHKLRFRQSYYESSFTQTGSELFDDDDIDAGEFFGGPFGFGANTLPATSLRTAANRYGSFNEYWYDALGRRVVIRSRQETGDSLCNQTCLDVTEYVVWDGDQVIVEQRTAFASAFNPAPYAGTVIYAHGLGIDNPLSIIRGSEYLVPHHDWRGEFVAVTNSTGEQILHNQTGVTPGHEQISAYTGVPRVATHWYGSLLRGNRGTDGLVYRRNRYYDPAAGRFTQEDPIGLAGGLNLYGYANGDPINLSDPFGLTPCLVYPQACIAAAFAVSSAAAGAFGQALENYQTDRPLSEGTLTAGLKGARDGMLIALTAEVGGRALGGLFGTGVQTTGRAPWTLGGHKSSSQWASQMQRRGWTPGQISEAIQGGEQFGATNLVNRGNSATRYVHPTTGRSVVIDDVTDEVLHVGGNGFRYE